MIQSTLCSFILRIFFPFAYHANSTNNRLDHPNLTYFRQAAQLMIIQNSRSYAIWSISIYPVVDWFSFFDISIGLCCKNKCGYNCVPHCIRDFVHRQNENIKIIIIIFVIALSSFHCI